MNKFSNQELKSDINNKLDYFLGAVLNSDSGIRMVTMFRIVAAAATVLRAVLPG